VSQVTRVIKDGIRRGQVLLCERVLDRFCNTLHVFRWDERTRRVRDDKGMNEWQQEENENLHFNVKIYKFLMQKKTFSILIFINFNISKFQIAMIQ
jgi:hypothetical protein